MSIRWFGYTMFGLGIALLWFSGVKFLQILEVVDLFVYSLSKGEGIAVILAGILFGFVISGTGMVYVGYRLIRQESVLG